MSDPTRALGWWDGTTSPTQSARDRAFGLSISEPLSPAGTVTAEHSAQDRRCGGVGVGLVVASGLAVVAGVLALWAAS